MHPVYPSPATLSNIVDERRLDANSKLHPETKSLHGQYMTPGSVARFMASLFAERDAEEVTLLDAGAGVGSLTAAFIENICMHDRHAQSISVQAYEIDPALAERLKETFLDCAGLCEDTGIEFHSDVRSEDFIETSAAEALMWTPPGRRYTHAILNPPYKKIHSKSAHRKLLRTMGIETGNLYTAFLAIAIKLLEPGGELVAITPRSFCNGPYFKPFRQMLLYEMAIRQIHIFESRTHAFKDDNVLQENVILYAVKGEPQGQVMLSLSYDTDFEHISSRTVTFSDIVSPTDPDRFIHIVADEHNLRYVQRMSTLPCALTDLGINVSTGPVVDFRLKAHLRLMPELDTVPLIYPVHCKGNIITWPLLGGKKPNAIEDAPPVQQWLYPNGYYTVTRRFSAKEERRRVVAAVHDPHKVPGEKIGFENHLNVFHRGRYGLSQELASGLAVYLNSTLVDICFRQFNGHTQVNVTDLYNLRYPDLATLEAWGRGVNGTEFPGQDDIDALIERDLF